MPFEIREIQATPNPNAMKFVLDREVSSQPMSFLTAEAAVDHPLASQLFSIHGVSSVLLLGDFITINKSSGAKWPDIKKTVKQMLSTSS